MEYVSGLDLDRSIRRASCKKNRLRLLFMNRHDLTSVEP